MIETIKRILGIKSIDYTALVADGAQIIDVRSKAEYKQGHISKSKNIPLDRLSAALRNMDKEKPVITCCRSGARSERAKNILRASGFKEVYNGGGWKSLYHKL